MEGVYRWARREKIGHSASGEVDQAVARLLKAVQNGQECLLRGFSPGGD